MGKYYLEENVELDSIPSLPYMLRLMMAADAIRSAIRWTNLLHKDPDSSTFDTDLLMSFIATAGRCGEAARLLKEGAKNHVIEREMLDASQSELMQTWDDCVGDDPSEMLKKFHRVRDKYFAHWDRWDEKVVRSFISQAEPVDRHEAFIEYSGDGKFLDTTFPWAYMTICRDLYPATQDTDVIGEFIEKAAEAMGGIVYLIDYLIAKLVKREGLSFRFEAS